MYLWPSVLYALSPKSRALAAVGLIAEACIVASMPLIDKSSRINSLVIFAVVLVAIVIAIVLVESRLFGQSNAAESTEQVRCEELTREKFYQKAADLISSANSRVLDTTWGPDAPPPTPMEDAARKRYMLAKQQAIRREVKYRELFSKTAVRAAEIQSAVTMQREQSNYHAKVIFIGGDSKPAIDVVLIDDRYVLMSYFGDHDCKFVYIECVNVCNILKMWFEGCWGKSVCAKQFLTRPRTVIAPERPAGEGPIV